MLQVLSPRVQVVTGQNCLGGKVSVLNMYIFILGTL